jgi:hypothetical protein
VKIKILNNENMKILKRLITYSPFSLNYSILQVNLQTESEGTSHCNITCINALIEY